MPPVIAYIAVQIAQQAIWFVVKAIITMVVNMAISAAFSKKPKAQGPFSRDRTLTVRQPAAPRRVVYGRIKVGGVLLFMHATDNDTKLHIIQALAGHQLEEIGDLYLNDELVPLDGSGNATGRFAGYVRVLKHLGSTTQTADAMLIAEAPDKWTTAHRLQGVAYAYVRLTGNADLFPNGIPNISFIVKGKNDIYDPRGVFLSRASTGTFIGSDGLIQTAAIDAARWQYDPADLTADPTLLLEAAATNLLTYSDNFTVAPWALRSGTLASNVALAPDGSMTADSLAGGSGSYVARAYAFTVDVPYTITCYFRSSAPTTINWGALTTGDWSAHVQTSVPISTTWERKTFTFVPTAAAGDNQIYFQELGGETLYMWGFQMEQATSATSYIPTTSAAVTRAADVSSTTGWTDNAALCISDYLTHTKYGVGAVYASHVDATALTAAANVCDEAVTLAAGGTEARYTLNGSFDSNQLPEDTIGEMLSAMHGKTVFSGGRWAIVAGAYSVPTVTLDEDDARGPIKVVPRVSRRDLFNAVKGLHTSPANQWQPADFPAVTNATYEAQDNGERIWRDISLPYTTSGATAQRIAKIELEKSRQQIVVNFPAKLTGLKLRAGDTCKLSLARFGWTEKVFEVLNWRFEVYKDAQGEDALGIDLTLRETASADYDWNSGNETLIDPAPDTGLPNPFTVESVSALACASGTAHLLETGDGGVASRIYASWTAPSSGWITEYQVEFKKSSDSSYIPSAPVRTGTSSYVSPVEDGIAYDVRVRPVNSIGVHGAWAYIANHVVVGKTEAPAEPTAFTVARLADGTRRYAWTVASTPADVRSGGGYRIRYYSGTTTDWSAMTGMHTGLLTSSPFENNELAAGTYTWAIKTVDSSGNESAAAKFINGTIGAPRLKNVLLQRIEQDLGWPGTLTGCFVHANTLIPLSTTTIAGLPAAISSLASTINAIGTNTNPIVYETPVIDLGSDVSFTPLVTVLGTGTATVTMKTGTTADGSVAGAYGALAFVAGKRYVQIKVSMADTAAVVSGMTLLLDAETQIDEFENVPTSTETATWFDRTSAGLGVGHFRIGSKSGQISSITSASIVALQSTGGAWTWELVNKSSTVNGEPAAEFKIRNAAGTLADALVDVMIKGPKV